MNPAISLHLAPALGRLHKAQEALDAANRDLGGLAATVGAAGAVIAAQDALITALTELVNPAVRAECGHHDLLRLHGRLNTLANEGIDVHT